MTIYESIFLWNFSMNLCGLPTLIHVLVFLKDAHKTCYKPGPFGAAWLKLSRIGQNEWEIASYRCILEQN